MSLNRLFYPLRLHADMPLRYRGGAVLQKPLDKGNIKPIRLVNLGTANQGSGRVVGPLVSFACQQKDFAVYFL